MYLNRAHRIEVESNEELKATNESNLPGERLHAKASIKPMNKMTAISRANLDEKHTTPVFATYGQYFLRL